MKPISLVALALCLVACTKDINNTEALKKSLENYLKARESQMSVDMSAMTVEVTSAQFTQETARAAVVFKAKGGGGSMNMSYTFDRKGDDWVVRGSTSQAGSAHQNIFPGGGDGAAPGAPATGQELPANHPQIPPADKKQ